MEKVRVQGSHYRYEWKEFKKLLGIPEGDTIVKVIVDEDEPITVITTSIN